MNHKLFWKGLWKFSSLLNLEEMKDKPNSHTQQITGSEANPDSSSNKRRNRIGMILCWHGVYLCLGRGTRRSGVQGHHPQLIGSSRRVCTSSFSNAHVYTCDMHRNINNKINNFLYSWLMLELTTHWLKTHASGTWVWFLCQAAHKTTF